MSDHESRMPNGEELSTEARVRVLGRELVMGYGAYGNYARVLALGPDIAKLTAGLDPDTFDTESADFKAGAEAAFSAISNSMPEMKPADEQH